MHKIYIEREREEEEVEEEEEAREGEAWWDEWSPRRCIWTDDVFDVKPMSP